MVDASANGALLSKSYTEAYEFLERTANNNYQWPSTRQPIARGAVGVHSIDAITVLSAQVTSLTNMVKDLQTVNIQEEQNEHANQRQPGNNNIIYMVDTGTELLEIMPC